MDNDLTVDVIIPVYRPGDRFDCLLKMLSKQSYPISRIIIMNTDESYWPKGNYDNIPELEVNHIRKRDFDHGATRNRAASYSTADIMVFMTDDAVPDDEELIGNLVSAFTKTGPHGETVAIAYARQLPADDCAVIERYTRGFNYPDVSSIKTKSDLPKLGIKTYFASNVCCAYRRDIFNELGGFVHPTIFNEDMIYAAKAINAGYAIVYAADARVIHSHNLSPVMQFHRNFDLAVSQAQHPEVFANIRSEDEGIKLVGDTAKWLIKNGRFYLIPLLILESGCKYLGYLLGKNYEKLPMSLVKWCSMDRTYWYRYKKGGKKA